MSHQDADHGTANAEDLQAALDWLVPDEVVADVQFRQPGLWSPLTLVFAAMMWSWSGKSTLTKRFAEARKTLAFGAAEDQQPGNSPAQVIPASSNAWGIGVRRCSGGSWPSFATPCGTL